MGGRFRQIIRVFLTAGVLWTPAALGDFPVPGLEEENFRQIGEQGFGDPGNSYAWGMAFFKGKLYVGTNRHFLCLVDDRVNSSGTSRNPEIPRDCAPDLFDMDLRARIYTYDPATGEIELVHIAPTFSTLLSDGSRVDAPDAAGYRTMIVFREKDGTEALYVGSFNSASLPTRAASILRSTDGRHFESVPLRFPFAESYYSFRSLTIFKGRLYMLGLSNDSRAPDLLEAENPAGGDFRAVSEVTFGDPEITGAFELAVFAGYLYVGTFGAMDGFQLLKTQATGEPPYTFDKVLVRGAYRGIKNQSVLSLQPYKDHLYLGTGVYFGSVNLIPDFRPAVAELLRVAADDTWDIVAGEERTTPDGFKSPISGVGPGFGNAFTGYLWRMGVHDGVLYVGTLDNAVFAQYAEDVDIEQLKESVDLASVPGLLPIIEALGPQEVGDMISAVQGGFDLFRTVDGKSWDAVSITGFHDSFSYGVRNLESTPYGLFLGTANPFFGMRVFLGQPTGTDTDGDSHLDGEDNCPGVWNLNQSDLDGDGVGDTCDVDRDGDCAADSEPVGSAEIAETQVDTDGNGIADGCDPDDDGDGVLDVEDNCPKTANYDQADPDGDGVGDACEVPASASQPAPTNSAELEEQTSKIPLPATCGVTGSVVLWMVFGGLLGFRPQRRSGYDGRRS